MAVAVVAVLTLVLLSSATRLVESESFLVFWTREGAAEYPASNPLRVQQGDEIIFNCTSIEHRTVTILTDVRQYDNCSCDAIPESCLDDQNVAQNCLPTLPVLRVAINLNNKDLPAVFGYVPGETYYFTDFGRGLSSGGNCLASEDGQIGLKIAVEVVDPDATTTAAPPTNTTTDVTVPNPNIDGLRSNQGVSVSPLLSYLIISILVTL